MQKIQFTIKDGRLDILGFPDAVRAIDLKDQKAKQIGHYLLHQSDLQLAQNYLELINTTESDKIQDALWKMAIISLIKCFQTSAARTTSLRLRTH